MKGMIFNLLENFIIDNFGDDVFEDILDASTLITQEPFVNAGLYPDQDFLELVSQACSKLNISPEIASRKFGEYCFPRLAKMHANFIDKASSAREFIESVDGVVHVEVLKLYPGVDLPKFDYDDNNDNTLNIKYISKRKLCFFMEGLLIGCATYFGEKIEYKQLKCYHKGDDHCLFNLKFGGIKNE